MWIIPKNISDTYPSVVDMKGSELDSEEFSQMCEKSLMLKSKPSLSPTWLRRWKRVKFIRLLCSRTLKNSHSESFVDALTSCLEDSHVSHSVEQGSEREQKIQDTSSPTSLKESESANHQLSFSKMLRESSVPKQQTENQFSSMCSKAWKKWVTEQRQEYSQRLKSGLLTKGSESLSWPTARTSDAEGGRIKTELTDKGFRSLRAKSNQWFGAKLRDAVESWENWATPNTMDGLPPRSEESLRKQAQTIRKGRSRPANLREQVNPRALEIYAEERLKGWPTPTTRDWKDGGTVPPSRQNPSKQTLGQRVAHENKEKWPTPTARDWKGTYSEKALVRKDGRSRGDLLPDKVKAEELAQERDITKKNPPDQWPTPSASEAEKAGYYSKGQMGGSLSAKALRGELGQHDQEKNSTSGKLPEQWPSPRLMTGGTYKGGIKHRDLNSTAGGRLNPYWVEQLMGVPVGWTQIPIEWID